MSDQVQMTLLIFLAAAPPSQPAQAGERQGAEARGRERES